MKTRFILILAAVFGSSGLFAQSQTEKQPGTVIYDSVLAKKVGADEYGMKTYVMAFLKRGTVKITDSTERAKLQMGHMQNIQRLATEGKLVVAGPFLDKQDIRGIFIFDVPTVEEARKLTETDPAIKAGTLEMELHPWYGSAALVESLRIHYTLEKKSH